MDKILGERALINCDRYDYYASAFAGVAAGLIDVLFVGKPGETELGDFTDAQTDEIVKKCAKWTGWKPRAGNEDSVASAIGHLERKFQINYDMQYANFSEHGFTMATKNHHIKSLAHSPDPIGLLFSVIDQFYGQSTFISNGKLITIRAESCELQGCNFITKIICGFCNWLGHLLSDVAGSSGGRGKVNSKRGSGVPIPFFNMFLACDFGKFQIGKDRQTFAEVMTRIFQEGYDLRFAGAMAMPVVLNELFVRAFWAFKRHFYHELDWKDCKPFVDSHRSLHKMLLVSNGSLCLIDGVDAYVRSGGNLLSCMLRMNIVVWARFITLVFKYLIISEERKKYEKNHILNQEEIKRIEKEIKVLESEWKVFLQEQQLKIDDNLEIIVKSIAIDDVDGAGTALNEIASLFGGGLQFNTFEEGRKFMKDPNSVLEL